MPSDGLPKRDTYRVIHVLFRTCNDKRHEKCAQEYKDDELKLYAYCTCLCHGEDDA